MPIVVHAPSVSPGSADAKRVISIVAKAKRMSSPELAPTNIQPYLYVCGCADYTSCPNYLSVGVQTIWILGPVALLVSTAVFLYGAFEVDFLRIGPQL